MSKGRTVRLLVVAVAFVAGALLLLEVPAGQGSQPPISVNSTADDIDPNDGDCTLREAILAANTGTDSGGVAGECEALDQPVIWFNIPTSDGNYDPADDFWTILPTSPLPAITANGTAIDGYKQDQGISNAQPNTNGPNQGSNADIKIELDGANANSDWGFRVDASNTSIRGFAIGRFDSVGVFVASGTGNTIAGNFLGTDIQGTQDRGSLIGVAITTAANKVGGSSPADRNVISGNDFEGVFISGSTATGNTVYGNLIGLSSGGAALGNHTGVTVDAPGVNFIGGTTPSQRNVISANLAAGVRLEAGEANAGNVVRGNYIGTTIAGDAARGNTTYGVVSLAPAAVIGGTASGSGNLISGNGTEGVQLFAVGNVIQGNHIGTNAAGTSAIPNLGSGVKIGTSGPSLSEIEDNVVGGAQSGTRNVISGNGDRGVLILQSDGNTIQNNYIGTNAAGTAAIPNQSEGIMAEDAADLTIGGTLANAGNIVSGNGDIGIYLLGPSTTGAVIQGNYIGLNAAGTAAIQNDSNGIFIWEAPGVLLGGSSSQARNVISGNDNTGVDVSDANDAVVRGNYIGTDASGLSAIRNSASGLLIFSAANTTVGGDDPADRNVISGNFGNGISLGQPSSTNNIIKGNYIGVGADGSTPIGNESGGIVIVADAHDNLVQSNLIAHNRGDGISAFSGSGNSITSNSIFANADPARLNESLGIDLEDEDDVTLGGVTLNDASDADTGANNLQNFPELTEVVSGSLRIEGTFDSQPNTNFRFEFFLNDRCDDAGHGEGQNFFGAATITTDGDGVISFTANSGQSVEPGKYVTATATNLVTNDTSEFSNCIQVPAAATLTPTPTDGAPSPTPTPFGQTPTPTPISLETAPPTPTSTGTPPPSGAPQLSQGDNDCDGDTDSVDALKGLQHVAAIGFSQSPACRNLGSEVASLFGDVDCDNDVDSVDALKILRTVAGFSVSQNEPCADIGDPL